MNTSKTTQTPDSKPSSGIQAWIDHRGRIPLRALPKKSMDTLYFILVMILLFVGFVTRCSAIVGKEPGGSFIYWPIVKEAGYLIASVAAFFVMYAIPYRAIFRSRFAWDVLYVLSIVFMLFVQFRGIEVNGAKRWIQFGPFTVQPSEFTKIFLIIVLAGIVVYMPQRWFTTFWGTVFVFVQLAPFLILGHLQNHLSYLIILCSIVLLMVMFRGGNKLAIICCVLAAVLLFTAVLCFGAPFRRNRIKAMFDPFNEEYRQGAGWQITQSIYAVSSGGVFGRGFSQSREKYSWLPEAENDYIFSVIAEEGGMVLCLFLILLYIIFVWRGVVLALRAPDGFSATLIVGCTAMFAVQMLLNVCINTNVFPTTGVPLPFFSAGGSSLIVCMMATGLVLNISQYTHQVQA